MMKRNLIGHCNKGTSDKVYMVCVRDNGDGNFSIIAKYGRRGNISQQDIKCTVDSIVSAEVAQKRLFNTKLNKGYEDVEEPGYVGSVNRTQPWLVDHLELETGSITKKPKKPLGKTPVPVVKSLKPTISALDGDGVVVCIKNVGMEEKFSENVEYIAEEHKTPEMLWVYDKYGVRGEYFRDRFVNLSQYTYDTTMKGKK